MTERKKILLRLDPAVHDAVARWAADELRSTNAQIEFLLRRALGDVGRMPGDAGRPVRRGRPRKDRPEEPEKGDGDVAGDGAGGVDDGDGGAGGGGDDDAAAPREGPGDDVRPADDEPSGGDGRPADGEGVD